MAWIWLCSRPEAPNGSMTPKVDPKWFPQLPQIDLSPFPDLLKHCMQSKSLCIKKKLNRMILFLWFFNFPYFATCWLTIGKLRHMKRMHHLVGWRGESDLYSFFRTRSYAALRATDLDWIVGPGYSLGGYILEKNHEKPTWNHGKPWKTMKNQPGTIKNHENPWKTMKNQPGTMKNHEKP